MTRDPVRPALQVGLYVLFYVLALYLFGWFFFFLGREFVGAILATFVAAALCNALCIRIYEGRGLTDVGLPWNRAAAKNIAFGLAGGVGSAALVLAAPLIARAAHFGPAADPGANWRSALFVPAMLFCGAAGEEMLFRGFGFQVLVRAFGPFATILPVGVLFAWAHSANPSFSLLGSVNTAGFGILFGYAFLRSHDIWLPIGLHFGWNLTLLLFGVNISGITIKATGYEMIWNAGPLWSGAAYGPEGSILTSAVLLLLAVYLWKARIVRQHTYLIDGPGGER